MCVCRVRSSGSRPIGLRGGVAAEVGRPGGGTVLGRPAVAPRPCRRPTAAGARGVRHAARPRHLRPCLRRPTAAAATAAAAAAAAAAAVHAGRRCRHLQERRRTSVVPIVLDHRLVSANDQALDYEVELSISNQNYLSFIVLFRLKSKIKNHRHKYHDVGDTKHRRHLNNFDLYGVVADITPSSHRACG